MPLNREIIMVDNEKDDLIQPNFSKGKRPIVEISRFYFMLPQYLLYIFLYIFWINVYF